MAKKFSLLLASMAMAAFAAPSIGSAAPALTDPPGTLVAPGALLQATNVGNVTVHSSLGVISCTTVGMTGELISNTGSTTTSIGVGLGFAGPCGVGPKSVKLTDITLKHVHCSIIGICTTNILFVVHLPAGVTCNYESPNMSATYTSGGDVIKVTNGDLKGTPAACEPGLLNGQFTIETDGGGSITFD